MWFLEYVGQIIVAILISISICFVYIFIKNSLNNSHTEKTRKFVQWVTSDNTYAIGNSRHFPLHIYLNNARIECNLSDKYAISTENEKNYESIILEEFKKFLTNQHINKTLTLIKSRHIVPDEIQFFYHLSGYLCNHETEYEFAGQKMFSDVTATKKYDSGGKDVTYSLSEFGIVYYKIQYLAIIGYLKIDISQPNDFLLKKHKEYLEEVLLTNTIELSYF